MFRWVGGIRGWRGLPGQEGVFDCARGRFELGVED